MTEEQVTLDRKQWIDVLIAIAKAEGDEGASEQVRNRWKQANERISEQVEITQTDLSELYQTVVGEENDE